MSTERRAIGSAIGILLVMGGVGFAFLKLVPCAFATSRNSTEGILATAQAWVEVAEPVPDVRGILSGARDEERVELRVRRVARDGLADGSFVTTGVVIHDDEALKGIGSELDEGSRVFLATSSGLAPEQVAYVVARRVEGTHVFVSGCGFDITAETQGLLGDRYEPVMRQLVGLTGHDAIYRLLAGVEPAPGHVLVEWTKNGPTLRMFSRTGRLIERGSCLAIRTEVGPLVPIFDAEYYLATDRGGLVLMFGLGSVVHLGDRVELSGRELSPDEALAYADRRSIRRCPGRLILTSGISSVISSP